MAGRDPTPPSSPEAADPASPTPPPSPGKEAQPIQWLGMNAGSFGSSLSFKSNQAVKVCKSQT